MFTFSGSEPSGFGIPNPLLGLGQFQVTDPFFDANEFLSFAQGAYLKIHHAAATRDIESVRSLVNESMHYQLQSSTEDKRWSTPIQQIVQASVLSVAHDNSVDTVTVRIASRTTAKKKNELTEDWTFTRPAANWGGLDAPPVTQCPSCGAPATLDENGACHYCKVPIKGVAGDWRLIGTRIVEAKKESNGCGWNGFWIFIILTTVVLPLVITGAILWFVRDTTNNAFNSFPNFSNLTSTTLDRRVPQPPGGLIPKTGSMRGTVSMSSGLNGGFPVEDVAFAGATPGPCKDQAAAATGLTVHSTGDNSNGVRQSMSITVTLPEGKQGPGTYADATATVVLAEQATPGETPTVALENNSWSGPVSITIANNTGTVTMKDLVPADPKWSKFAGTLTFSCTG